MFRCQGMHVLRPRVGQLVDLADVSGRTCWDGSGDLRHIPSVGSQRCRQSSCGGTRSWPKPCIACHPVYESRNVNPWMLSVRPVLRITSNSSESLGIKYAYGSTRHLNQGIALEA